MYPNTHSILIWRALGWAINSPQVVAPSLNAKNGASLLAAKAGVKNMRNAAATASVPVMALDLGRFIELLPCGFEPCASVIAVLSCVRFIEHGRNRVCIQIG